MALPQRLKTGFVAAALAWSTAGELAYANENDAERETTSAEVVSEGEEVKVKAVEAKEEDSSAEKDIDPIDEIPVNVSNKRSLNADAARLIASNAHRGKINLILYGTHSELATHALRAVRESINDGVPIGAIYLAKENENILGEDGNVVGTQERSGIVVYHAGQSMNKDGEYASDKKDILILINSANEYRQKLEARAQANNTQEASLVSAPSSSPD